MKKSVVVGSFATALVLSLGLSAVPAQAVPLSAFSENFEGSLAAWTDITPATPQAQIVNDPLRAGNHVLSFATLGSGGSIYSTEAITTTGDFTVSFEYLGLAVNGSVAGDIGGFFGVSQSFPGNHYWVAGSIDGYGPINLIDDNTWHTYNLTFSSPVGQTVHLMYEDFVGSGGVAGDAYFDNIRFNDANVAPAPFQNTVPEPETYLLMLSGLGLMGYIARRRKQKR